MAKIEIYSRDVENVPDIPVFGVAQHLFLFIQTIQAQKRFFVEDRSVESRAKMTQVMG